MLGQKIGKKRTRDTEDTGDQHSSKRQKVKMPIKEALQELIVEKSALQPEALKEKLICDYQINFLNKLEAAFQQADSMASLEEILKEHWTFIIETGRCLGYTALPEDGVTLLLCDIAKYLGDVLQKPALSILMPTIAEESTHDDYPHLKTICLKHVIKTHILSERGDYLIPIGLLASLPILYDFSKVPNYYYNYDVISDDGYLAKSEVNRLWAHSQDTRDLLAVRESYESYLNDNINLLGHVHELIKWLRFNSVHGIGAETSAGGSAYGAIIRFNEYYNTLSDSQKNQIPMDVRVEIDLLIQLSSDASVNSNATENIETCLATRADKLSIVVKANDNEACLSAIGIDGDTRQVLLREAKKKFEMQKENLASSIQEGKYIGGSDKSGITSELLRHLDLQVTAASKQDFRDFLTLSAEEIKNTLENDEGLCRDVLSYFNDVESFVLFCITGTTDDRLKVILSIVGYDVFERIIENTADISACLVLLQNETFHIVLDAFKACQYIKNGSHFSYLFKALNEAQRSVFVNAFADKWHEIIKGYYNFIAVFEVLDTAQRSVLFDDFSNEWHEIIKDRLDFIAVFEMLDTVQRSVFVNAFADKWHKIIKNRPDFSEVFWVLNEMQRSELVNAFAGRWHKTIKNGHDFSSVFKVLDTAQRSVFVNAFADKWHEIIKGYYNFIAVFEVLDKAQRSVLFDDFADKWHKIIKDRLDFMAVFEVLNAAQHSVFVNALAGKWQ